MVLILYYLNAYKLVNNSVKGIWIVLYF